MISPATPAASLPEGRRPNIFQVGAMTLCLALLALGILLLFSHDGTTLVFAVLWFLLPATIYILGWFYYMPELLGARRCSPRGLHERWTLWLRTSGLLGLACLLGCGVL